MFHCRGNVDTKILATALELAKELNLIVVVDDICCSNVLTLLRKSSFRNHLPFVSGTQKKNASILKKPCKKFHEKNICFSYMYGQDVTHVSNIWERKNNFYETCIKFREHTASYKINVWLLGNRRKTKKY